MEDRFLMCQQKNLICKIISAPEIICSFFHFHGFFHNIFDLFRSVCVFCIAILIFSGKTGEGVSNNCWDNVRSNSALRCVKKERAISSRH